MNQNAMFTIISKNYISYARVLINSFLKYHADWDCFVLFVDKIEGYLNPETEKFKTIRIGELRIPDRDAFLFKYNILELNTAVKPFCIEFLFDAYRYQKVVYFDPDILILGSLSDLFQTLDDFFIVLTPHITSSIPDDGKQQSEIEIMRAGCYNLGFIGLSHYEKLRGFLSWWKSRLSNYCFSSPEIGLFVDQKWIDLVPSLFEGVHVCRDPGYNVAYWNLHERVIEFEEGGSRVNGGPLFFYHFSGIEFNNLKKISKFQNRYQLKDIKNLENLFLYYKKLIFQEGYEESKRWPYFYGFFDNGVRIPDVARRIYHSLGCPKIFGNPHRTAGQTSFFKWLNAPASRGPRVTNLLDFIYQIRPDLQQAFPNGRGAECNQLVNWAKTSLSREYRIDKAFLRHLTERDQIDGFTLSFHKGLRFNFVENFLWNFGTKHALWLKRLPLIKDIGERVYSRLARKRMEHLTPKPSDPGSREKMGDGSLGINIAGYISSESGTGEAVRSNIRAIELLNIPHVLINLETQYRQEDATYTSFTEENIFKINYIHVNADQVPVFVSQKGMEYFEGRYNIGFWVWELSDFPKEWHPHFRYFHEIWTPSRFCGEAISAASPVPVIRIPHSINIGQVRGGGRSHVNLPEGTFIFLFLFDMLSYFERKNPLAVIEAFKRAFQPTDEAMLVLKFSNSERNPSGRGKILEAAKDLRVKVIDRYLYKDELYALMKSSDCFVSLHRSEGFGLPLAEAMSLGKPVIATAYSGNMDYMNVNNSFLVKYNMIEIEDDVGPYQKGNVWADPDVDHAAELMRYIYHHRDHANKIGERGSEDMRTCFSPFTIGKLIQKRIDIILSEKEGHMDLRK